MNTRNILLSLLPIFVLASCSSGSSEPAETSPEEVKKEVMLSEQELLRKWFSEKMTDSENFTDKLEYQYYARTLGLDKDYFLNIDNWEVFYNERININRDIDEKSIYLIRLDPYKLLEIYAKNNSTGVEQICDFLGATPEQLYYNWGYTMTSLNYTSNHNDNKCTYSQGETSVFGEDNGEKRNVVMSTHLLTIAENKVSYSSSSDKLKIVQRDLLRSAGTDSHDYLAYTEEERSPSLYVNDTGISRVTRLNLFNGWKEAEDITSIVMVNMSPFSYGCSDEDKIDLTPGEEETAVLGMSEELTETSAEATSFSESEINTDPETMSE